MDVELKTKWVAALRSGEYEQGRNYLCNDHSGDYTFCCLGVLCDLINPNGWRSPTTDADEDGNYETENVRYFDHMADFPAAELLIDAGLTIPIATNLASKNDNGTPFAEIADYIEENL